MLVPFTARQAPAWKEFWPSDSRCDVEKQGGSKEELQPLLARTAHPGQEAVAHSRARTLGGQPENEHPMQGEPFSLQEKVLEPQTRGASPGVGQEASSTWAGKRYNLTTLLSSAERHRKKGKQIMKAIPAHCWPRQWPGISLSYVSWQHGAVLLEGYPLGNRLDARHEGARSREED